MDFVFIYFCDSQLLCPCADGWSGGSHGTLVWFRCHLDDGGGLQAGCFGNQFLTGGETALSDCMFKYIKH